MPTVLVLTFPLGRYHATPWGRQVNEGAVEIPPSPWRVLRMLYAVWRTRAPELDEATVHGLLRRLAEPPTFHVPRHTAGHTRHYYKTMALKQEAPETDKTLDGFAVFERDADLAIEWTHELHGAERAALERLAGSIPYFGRADSVCTGTVNDQWTPEAHETWAPVDIADTLDPHEPATGVLAPHLPLDVASLLATPGEVRKAGLPLPASTRLFGYQRRRGAGPLPPRPRIATQNATTVRFTLLQSGLPPATDAVVYTDLLRQAALKKLGGSLDGTVLGGRSASGQAAAGNHTHAHFLPLISEDRRLTGLVVWAPEPLPSDELKALTDVRDLRSRYNDSWRATLRVAGVGDLADSAPELSGQPVARAWRTVTPFTPSRFPKRRSSWTDHLAAEVRRELDYRGIDTDCEVEVHDGGWAAFRRYRPTARGRRDPRQGQARQPAAMIKLTFAEPVAGPLALGHLAHFGLGLFLPQRD